MSNQVTFELSELSYEELLDSFKDISEFLKYLDEVEASVQEAKVIDAKDEKGENG